MHAVGVLVLAGLIIFFLPASGLSGPLSGALLKGLANINHSQCPVLTGLSLL